MLETLYKLGITPSNSRPRVSNDNAYAESLFKTLKYRPNYQPKGFKTLQAAREWVSGFVRWYRYEHHHSGICYLTPAQVSEGNAQKINQNIYIFAPKNVNIKAMVDRATESGKPASTSPWQ